MPVQVRAREQSLAEDEQRHPQLKAESKKQVSTPSLASSGMHEHVVLACLQSLLCITCI